jgi:hypothetical protein
MGEKGITWSAEGNSSGLEWTLHWTTNMGEKGVTESKEGSFNGLERAT